MIKPFLLALLMGTALSTGAIAADIGGGKGSAKDEPRGFIAPEPRDSGFNWTRAWIFLGGGYGMTNTEVEMGYNAPDAPTSPLVDGIGAEGVFGEVQIGLDKQVGNLVFGIFGGAGYSDATFGIVGQDAIHQKESYFGGLRGGVLMNSSTLLYVAGGYRTTNFEIDDAIGSGSEFVDGLFGEGGVEGRVSDVVGWKVFGRYTLYDSADIDADCFKFVAEPDELQIGAGLTISVGSPAEKLF